MSPHAAAREADRPVHAFRHEALLYAGQREFLERTAAFIRDGLDAEEPILTVVSAEKIELLRAELGADADRVLFADMDDVGANPARIIPAWRDFVDERSASGRNIRGIGEPIYPSRSAPELVECHRHESLLNLAFADAPGFWLLCPYDTSALDPAVIDEAHRNHPFIANGGHRESASYRGLGAVAAPFDEPLPEPRATPRELVFRTDSLEVLRRFVAHHAARAGMGASPRTEDLLLAVNEVATNSVRHGGGEGVLRVWQEADALICEVRDSGRIDQPLAGRERPGPDQLGGHGLWVANQVCDLVQVRSLPSGTLVRLHMRPG